MLKGSEAFMLERCYFYGHFELLYWIRQFCILFLFHTLSQPYDRLVSHPMLFQYRLRSAILVCTTAQRNLFSSRLRVSASVSIRRSFFILAELFRYKRCDVRIPILSLALLLLLFHFQEAAFFIKNIPLSGHSHFSRCTYRVFAFTWMIRSRRTY